MKKITKILLSALLIINLFSTIVFAQVSNVDLSDQEATNDVDVINELSEKVLKDKSNDKNIGKEYGKYKSKNSRQSNIYSSISSEFEDDLNDEIFKQSYEASKYIEYLSPITDDNYEVALAKSNGSYIFLDSDDSYDQSIKIAEESGKVIEASDTINDEEYIPCVIDSKGIVVYSTLAMGRAIKYTNGVVDNSQVTNLFANASDINTSWKADNYINHNYAEDVPIIESTPNALKVMVSGYIGWGKIDPNNSTYDFTVVPMNQVTNPSYYQVVNNQITHFISSDMTSTTVKGNTITIGMAPKYLKSEVKYYSYDGKYFYTNLTTLANDFKNNTRANSVNANNPYYNYYQYLPYRSKTSYTASELNNFINSKTNSNSKLRGIGSKLIDVQEKYGVNAGIILGIAINESGWGTSSIAQNKNNLFGLNAVDSSPGQSANYFSSVDQCIEEFAKMWISSGYSDPQDSRYYGGFLGNKDLGTNVKYASDPYWGEKNASHYFNVDKSISGFNNCYDYTKLFDYNNYTLGLITGDTAVYFNNGSKIYNVSNKNTAKAEVVNGIVAISGVNNSYNINNVSSYRIIPVRTTTLNSEFSGYYDWNTYGYIDKTKVKILNNELDSVNNLKYRTHVQNYGWQSWKFNGAMSGTSGEGLRLEGIEFKLQNQKYSGSIQYKTHVQNYGWQDWSTDGEMSGTSGEGLRLEGIKIQLTGEMKNHYDVYYRVHAEDYGWLGWTKNGAPSGTEGLSKRLEGIEVVLVDKDGAAPGSTANSCIAKNPTIGYSTHVQNYGWKDWSTNGQMSGTSGENLRVESVQIALQGQNYNGSVEYRTHVENYGWQDWSKDGNSNGTIGKGLRVEAVQIKLTDEMAKKYDIYYRVYAEGYNWLGWAKNGASAGTEGLSKRLEAIEIVLVEKGKKAPGSTANSFVKPESEVKSSITYRTHVENYGWQDWSKDGTMSGTSGKALRLEGIEIKLDPAKYSGDILYSTHIQNYGWQAWKSNGEMSGTSGKALRLEAIKIKLNGTMESKYDIYYRTHLQNCGWLDWAKNGEPSGSEGLNLRLEGIEIVLVEKGKEAPGNTVNSFVKK